MWQQDFRGRGNGCSGSEVVVERIRAAWRWYSSDSSSHSTGERISHASMPQFVKPAAGRGTGPPLTPVRGTSSGTRGVATSPSRYSITSEQRAKARLLEGKHHVAPTSPRPRGQRQIVCRRARARRKAQVRPLRDLKPMLVVNGLHILWSDRRQATHVAPLLGRRVPRGGTTQAALEKRIFRLFKERALPHLDFHPRNQWEVL